jgi:DNA uptake protein ComE-like DNA-binding protein
MTALVRVVVSVGRERVGRNLSCALPVCALPVCAVLLTSPVFAQDTLPDAPGKQQTINVCGTCHEAAKATSVKLTREGWVETIDRMKAFGAEGTPDEFAAILDYLSAHFKGDVVQALDMNTAEAIDLESVLQLLRRESAAVLQYRAKRGQLSSLDDLKGLDPVIYRKIEAKKDRIVFLTQTPEKKK